MGLESGPYMMAKLCLSSVYGKTVSNEEGENMKRKELKEFVDCEKKLEFIEDVLKKAEEAVRTGDTLEISTDDPVIKNYVAVISKAFKEDMLTYISAIRVDYTKVTM